ncbi:hypothetical protein BBJ28_00018317 [Nothophytophthora sp. Chile5]|nr:hypothetical protein BBJ28_00018317 [Nothophytophthora sp. Chile5]
MYFSCRRNRDREAEIDLEAATATFQLPQQPRRLHRRASNRSTAILTTHDEEDLALWRLDVKNIEPIRPLGAGAYGTVWLATYLGETVVVKKLSPPMPPSLPRSRSWRKNSRPSGTTATAGSTSRTRASPAQTALQRFVAEIRFLATLSHPKIVAFYGVAWTSSSSHGGGKGSSPPPKGPTDLQMVLEYMSRGDLRQYLARTRGDIRARAWSSRKLAMALDIAEALAYLHSRRPDPVLHRDLKSRNILLDATYTAKVADFGVSRYGLRTARPMEGEENALDDDQEDEMAMTRAVGTSRWIAPEVLAGEARYSTAVDVYSFGVILSELDSHELPFADVCLSNGESLSEHAILELLRAGALQPTLSDRCPRGIAMLMFECLTLEPTLRPTSAHVADRLRALLDRERRVSDVGDDVHLGEFNGQNSFLGIRAGEEVTSGYSSSISIASSSGISEKHGFHYALLEEA